MKRFICLVAALLLVACAQTPSVPSPADFPPEAAPQAMACPKELAAGTRCLQGRDSAGAVYIIVMPPDWNGTLVLHAHGGPLLGTPTLKRVEEDLDRWSVVPRAGYAWAASSFHQGGVAVRAAAEDTERLRHIFLQHVVTPKLTLLHGQSWGASVAAKAAETYTAGRPYDAVLLTSGVLAGGSKAYDIRLDLRAVYQALCGNHPRPDEPQYPLWMGLPEGAKMTRTDLAARADECLGLVHPAAQRSPAQAERLKTLTTVLRLPESAILPHLTWATFHFQDIAQRYGRSVFGNLGVRYQGSADDDALNARVARYAPDPTALAAFSQAADLGGRIPVPVLTVHGVHDLTAFVEMDNSFAATMAKAGHADTLVQTFSDDSSHSYLSDATYVALLGQLQGWVTQQRKPSPVSVSAACVQAQASFPSTCRFLPDFRPAPLATRVAPRE
ncbi:hypothetical protein LRH25_00055 [Ideonella azotifigens]|uniref:DUF6351 family protein n=1 Tax=Ideonella azotifigens TaxID=513160 RepID=A0ABN1KAZ1_9BURK|nr:hypothetical protein [Ideonella azotifigens]MCD2338736.1 hypothetical protein [Ideonella azotifigens]